MTINVNQFSFWIVWHPAGGEENPEEGHTFKAYSAQDAAEQWGKFYEVFRGQCISDGEFETVMICRSGDFDNIETFIVCAQTCRNYIACKKL